MNTFIYEAPATTTWILHPFNENTEQSLTTANNDRITLNQIEFNTMDPYHQRNDCSMARSMFYNDQVRGNMPEPGKDMEVTEMNAV